MTAKTKAQQDELSGPFTRAMRQAMVSIDKIASMDGEDWKDREQAMMRIERYSITRRYDMLARALGVDAALEASPSP
ncbi:MAG: hypothetical protein ACR2OE_15030 [Thermomicrobiales bacterium]